MEGIKHSQAKELLRPSPHNSYNTAALHSGRSKHHCLHLAFLLETQTDTKGKQQGWEGDSRVLFLPVEVVEAWLEVLCTAYGACVPVLKLDPIEAQHELIGPDKTLSDFLGAFKCLENNPLGLRWPSLITVPKEHWVAPGYQVGQLFF